MPSVTTKNESPTFPISTPFTSTSEERPGDERAEHGKPRRKPDVVEQVGQEDAHQCERRPDREVDARREHDERHPD